MERISESKHIHITSGCNQAFFASLLVTAAPGSTVLMVNPCYFNQKAAAEALGLDVKLVNGDPDKGFIPDITQFIQAIDPSVSVIALVSPNNPTGAIYPTALLEKLLKICNQHKIWLILDETYREFATQNNQPLHT